MHDKMELSTRLVKSEHKNLYPWSIQEFDDNGSAVSGDYVPWHWTLYFRATDCKHQYSVNRSKFSDDGVLKEAENLQFDLESFGGEFDLPVSFSMFGTNRQIRELTLSVRKLTGSETDERCVLSGNVKWEHEEEFSRKVTVYDDELQFVIFLTEEKFERLLRVANRSDDFNITFSAGMVDGLYAGWTPDIKTTRIKVLTASQHELEAPEGFDFEPPVLGHAMNFGLAISRIIKRVEPIASSDPDPLPAMSMPSPTIPTAQQLATEISARITGRLDQIKLALWGALAILVLLLIFKR